MTDAAAARLSRPYGRHAAARGAERTVPTTKGPGRHAIAGPRADLAELLPVSERPALVTRAPLAALVALLALLLLAVGITTTAAGAGAQVIERPAHTAVTEQPATACGDYCGTDAGQITGPATFDGAPTA